jgi:hypothetical protein
VVDADLGPPTKPDQLARGVPGSSTDARLYAFEDYTRIKHAMSSLE